jgi:hypothetical protein
VVEDEPETNKDGGGEQIRTGGGNKSGRGPETNKADKGSPSKVSPIKVSPTKARKDRPLSFEEVSTYAVKLGLPRSDGEAFFDAKEGNGWKNGSSQVKDWKATFRNWKANGYHPSQKANGGSGAGGYVRKFSNPDGF